MGEVVTKAERYLLIQKQEKNAMPLVVEKIERMGRKLTLHGVMYFKTNTE